MLMATPKISWGDWGGIIGGLTAALLLLWAVLRPIIYIMARIIGKKSFKHELQKLLDNCEAVDCIRKQDIPELKAQVAEAGRNIDDVKEGVGELRRILLQRAERDRRHLQEEEYE